MRRGSEARHTKSGSRKYQRFAEHSHGRAECGSVDSDNKDIASYHCYCSRQCFALLEGRAPDPTEQHRSNAEFPQSTERQGDDYEKSHPGDLKTIRCK